MRRSPSPPSRPARRPARPVALAAAAVLVLLAATAQERTWGSTSDEKQMLATAVSVAELGEVGVARWWAFNVPRPQGDAVSPYGMGQPLLEALPALLAAPWERAFGPGSSQTLFAGLEVLLVTAGALAAGLLARALGASPGLSALAVLATGLGSPLAAYASSGYSEPLQGAALAGALLFAALAAREGAPRRAAALAALAGACAGWAVLAKSINLPLVPLVLLPLVLDGAREARRRLRDALAGSAGAAALLGVWLAFEIARFGRPLASYGDQGFHHPPLDGLWRLLAGPSCGLLWLFPLLLFALPGAARLARAGGARGSLAALVLVPAFLLLTSAAWWAWDGTEGWGPRLLVPALPLLATLAALGAGGSPLRVRGALLLALLGAGVNALGVLQPESTAGIYLWSTPPVAVEGRLEREIPKSYRSPGPGGRELFPRALVAARDAAFSEIRLHAFLLRARLTAESPGDVAERLSRPPWSASRPDALPDLASPAYSAVPAMRFLLTPFSWVHLGSSLRRAEGPAVTAWDDAMSNQVVRAFDVEDAARALPLSRKLWAITRAPRDAAFLAEALRVSGRHDELLAFVGSLPEGLRASPSVQTVLALERRDAGDEATARALMARVARLTRAPAAVRAEAQPLPEWPRGLGGFLPRPMGP